MTPKGRKVFIVLYRTRDGFNKLRKYTIGPYGQTTLAIARVVAQKVLAARLEGKDPAGEKRQQRRRIMKDSVDEVVAEYIARHIETIRSAVETKRVLNREVLSRWAGRSMHDIGKHDVLKLLDEIMDRGSPGMANRTFSVVRALFSWSVGRGVLEKSPCAGLSRPTSERSRDRVLSDDELRSVILAARQIGFPYGSIVELLALTAQRREEVAGLCWNELDLEGAIWTIPSSRSKNGRSHTVHLTPAAIGLLSSIDPAGMLVFGNRIGKPFNDFSKRKRELDLASRVGNWVIHDLRRTAVSGMARLGIAPHVADKILNHQSGSISGVAAIYQRHEFLAERKEALIAWGEHVEGLVRARHDALRAA